MDDGRLTTLVVRLLRCPIPSPWFTWRAPASPAVLFEVPVPHLRLRVLQAAHCGCFLCFTRPVLMTSLDRHAARHRRPVLCLVAAMDTR
jgi:hypothetical protein